MTGLKTCSIGPVTSSYDFFLKVVTSQSRFTSIFLLARTVIPQGTYLSVFVVHDGSLIISMMHD